MVAVAVTTAIATASLPAAAFVGLRKEEVKSVAQRSSRVVSALVEQFIPRTSEDDLSQQFTLVTVRDALIRQEDSIIYSLIERAQFRRNTPTYDRHAIPIPGFDGSLLDYILKETEALHAKVRRYTSPDEHPFFPEQLPEALLPPLTFPEILAPFASSININPSIMKLYLEEVLPAISEPGNDFNYGSAATLDALSKRIHYGKFVAEAKFTDSPSTYIPLIRNQDREGLMQLLTFQKVEESVIQRVERKASVYSQEVTLSETPSVGDNIKHKISPQLVARMYEDWIMPLTKEVQVSYLLRRLEWDRQ
eukprot:jgi/Chlat1/1656/Chrsp127S00090